MRNSGKEAPADLAKNRNAAIDINLPLLYHIPVIEKASVHRDGFGAMEYFVLALIGRADLTTLYAFRQRAGLEPGAVRSALKNLGAEHLIERGEEGRRRRRDLALTEEGRRFLAATWTAGMREYADSEAVMRMATVARLMGDSSAATKYLERMAGTYRSKAVEARMRAESLNHSQSDPLSAYGWMRVLSEAHRRDADSVALAQMGQHAERPDL